MVGSMVGPMHRGEFGYYDENRHWHAATPMLPDELRVLPDTVPLDYLSTHRVDCRCQPCLDWPLLTQLRRAKLRCAALRRQ